MNCAMQGVVWAEAHSRAAKVKADGTSGGHGQNEARTRQAVRGIKEMFREDGLL